MRYNTNYHVRAYATNAAGTSYSADLQFRTQDTPYTIGQFVFGGKIFYIDSTGEHGFIYPAANSYINYAWAQASHTNVLIGGTSVDIGTGQSNTLRIIAAGNNAANSAAMACDQYVSNGYSDWYLPSAGELGLLRFAIGFLDIPGGSYWSSSEVDQGNAYVAPLNSSASLRPELKNTIWGVVPIRSY